VGRDISTEESGLAGSPRSGRKHEAWGGAQRNPRKRIVNERQAHEVGDSSCSGAATCQLVAAETAVTRFAGSCIDWNWVPGVPLRSTPGFMLPSASRTGRRSSLQATSSPRKSFFSLLLTVLAACHAGSSSTPLSVSTLLSEYRQSTNLTRQKYDGKEITVRGFAQATALLPHNNAEQGSVWLQESDRENNGKVGCWFSNQQAGDFSKIHGGEHLTIKGVFNGETGVDLKFCRLIKVE
jgi:hypothetical protein